MRHGERVIAHSAMGEQGAYVGDEGQMTRLPESPSQRGGNEQAYNDEDGVGDEDGGPSGYAFFQALSWVRFHCLFNTSQHGRREHDDWNPCGPCVVFLVGRKRKEEQCKRSEEAQQPCGTGSELEIEDVVRYILASGVIKIKVYCLS